MDLRHLKEMIRDIEIGSLTTIDQEGVMHSRPMAGLASDDEAIWFYTDSSSPKVMEIQEDPRVNVSFSDPAHNRYVSVSGTCEVVHDSEKIKAFWKPSLRTWFPAGPDAPDLALLRVSIDQAEYWDTESSAMAKLLPSFGKVTPVVRSRKIS